ncbi:Bifunctional nuclease 1 [Linum perenne]
MASLQGPVICPAVRVKHAGFDMCAFPMMNGCVVVRAKVVRNELLGFRGILGYKSKVGLVSRRRNFSKVHCALSSSSNDNGNMAENFNEKDDDYVNSSVVEAVEVKSGADGFMIKMRDGRHLRCVHNNPQGSHLPDYAPHPAIVLKMEDGTGLLLPIIVLEMPSALLMAAVRNVQIARPTMYQVVKEMIDKMGYEVKLVRVTRRVHEAYYAQLYLTKVSSLYSCSPSNSLAIWEENILLNCKIFQRYNVWCPISLQADSDEHISFDLRPSDAINIAVRCKVLEHAYK